MRSVAVPMVSAIAMLGLCGVGCSSESDTSDDGQAFCTAIEPLRQEPVQRGSSDKSTYYLEVVPTAIAAADKVVPNNLTAAWHAMADGVVADGDVLAEYDYSDVWVDSIGARRRPTSDEQAAVATIADYCIELKYTR